MLDPIVDFFTRVFYWMGRGIGKVIAAIFWPFVMISKWYTKRGWIVRGVVGLLALVWLGSYLYFFWQSQRWTNFDPDYVNKYEFTKRASEPGTAIADKPGVCGTSGIIEVASDLIDFNVNQNQWISSMALYKIGLLGLPWKNTPFFDNKAAFQLGINEIVRRTAQEAVDRLGRVRGTSQIDQDLQNARQNVYYTEDLWYWSLSPFGPTTPTPSRYRQAVGNLKAFNARLANCTATFDPRADNLLKFLDQMTNAIGSTSDILNDRINASNAGWFDVRADDRFWFTYGQIYALNGLLQAARHDFANIVRERNLTKTWNEAELQSRRALDMQPLIISNGGESAFIMPSHLATMGFYLLRVRANLSEMRDILDR